MAADTETEDSIDRLSKDVREEKEDPDLFKEELMKCTTNEQRVAFLLADAQVMAKVEQFVSRMFPRKEIADLGKSAPKASKRRKKANDCFKSKDFKKALENYNEAILWAPHDSYADKLSLCFSSRSAAFFHLNRFRDTILDIEEAIKRNYPTEKAPILLIRKLKCLKSLGEEEEAKRLVKDIKKYIKNNIKDPTFKKEFTKQMQSLPKVKPHKEEPPFSLTLKEPSDRLIGANSSVKMGYDPAKGRTIEATRNIDEGEVILFEEPFATCLAPLYNFDFCHHCLNHLNGRFVPCSQCVAVRFCSNKCLDTSWRQYHWAECAHFDSLKLLSVGHFSMRTLLTVGIEEALRVEAEPIFPLDQWPERGFRHDYRSISSLCDFSECYDYEKFLYYSLAAVSFGIFTEKYSLVEENDRLPFCTLFLKHIFQIQRNISIITSPQIAATQFKGLFVSNVEYKPINTGVGLFVTRSLFNHSCNPNVKQHFVDSRILLTSCRAIKEGEEVCISYHAFPYKSVVMRERQEFLKTTFNFACKCAACLVDEPLLPYFRCPLCDGNLVAKLGGDFQTSDCNSCGKRDLDLGALLKGKKKLDAVLAEGIACLDQLAYGRAKGILLEAKKLSRKVYQKDSPFLVNLKVSLSTLYQNKANPDFEAAIRYRREAMKLEKSFYGDNAYQILLQYIHLNTLLHEKCRAKKDRQAFNEAKKSFGETKAFFVNFHSMEFRLITRNELIIYAEMKKRFVKN